MPLRRYVVLRYTILMADLPDLPPQTVCDVHRQPSARHLSKGSMPARRTNGALASAFSEWPLREMWLAGHPFDNIRLQTMHKSAATVLCQRLQHLTSLNSSPWPISQTLQDLERRLQYPWKSQTLWKHRPVKPRHRVARSRCPRSMIKGI